MKKLLAKIAVFALVMAVAVGISAVAASAAVYKLSEGLTSGLTMQNNTYLGTGDYFTVVTGGNALSITQTEKDYYVDTDGVVKDLGTSSFGYRLKTNGRGSKESRCISFTTKGAADLEIYAVSGSSAEPNRYLTIENSTGEVAGAADKLCTGPLTERYNGKEQSVVRKAKIRLDAPDTYYVYCADGSFSIYDLIVNDEGTDKVIYWPLAKQVTDARTDAYPDNVNAEEKITEGNAIMIGGSDCVSNKAIYNGSVSNPARIRLGVEAYNAMHATEPTIANNGFITFDYDGSQSEGSFKVDVLAASTGTTSTRNVYIGYYDDTKEGDARFEDIDVGAAYGTNGTNIIFTVPVTELGNRTYAIYVKPYDKSNDGILDPAENTDIRGIDLLYYGGYYTTPSITLDEPVVNSDDELTVTGHFNDFDGDAFEVSKIWISAASGEEDPQLAVWHGDETDGANQVIFLKDDGDGTASFTAYFTKTKGGAGFVPDEDVKLQAHAIFDVPDDPTNEDVGGLYPEISKEIVSNAVRYYAQ